MAKQTLKEKLEARWLGRRVRLPNGDTDTIIEIDNSPWITNCPLIGHAGRYPTHILTRLKPKQKQKQVSYEELARWLDDLPCDAADFNANSSAPFQSLCELLGVRKP